MATGSVTCPYCGEAILATAKKCKHCGEWLENASNRPGSGASSRGSVDARAVAKGLKEKEYADQMLGGGVLASIVIAVGVGYFVGSWLLGIAIFIGLAIAVRWSYYKE